MKITRCVPLTGEGVVARHGDLIAVTGGGPDDLLLSTVAAVAAAAGDGSALVLDVTRAALGCNRRPAWACAGITAEGAVAVLVHGRAVAAVQAEGGQDVQLSAADSPIPVSRTFTGMTVTVSLLIGGPQVPDPRFRLDGGVVHGGGLAVTVSAGMAGPTVMTGNATPSAFALRASPTVTSIAPVAAAAGALADRRTHDGRWPVPDADSAEHGAPEPVLVEGAVCAGEHFNDPAARHCRQCGISMDQPPAIKRRQRPPLGVLILDDGAQFTLDTDYVIGREPRLDGDVIAGRARPLRVSDPDGTVSRVHLRVSLVGWRVEISDLGSAYGSVLHYADSEPAPVLDEPTVIEPGARIGIGHRSMRYLTR
jgi:hypothetical protein